MAIRRWTAFPRTDVFFGIPRGLSKPQSSLRLRLTCGADNVSTRVFWPDRYVAKRTPTSQRPELLVERAGDRRAHKELQRGAVGHRRTATSRLRQGGGIMTVLTEAEAARYLKIGRTKFRSLVDRGLIEYVRIDQGRRDEMRRFTTDLLDSFLERSVVSVPATTARQRTSKANPYY